MNDDIIMEIDEIEIIIQKLMEMPEALYLLYKDKGNGTFIDVNREIIDRGKECKRLDELGILELSSTKHIHNAPYNYTSLGKKVLNALSSKKIFEGFERIETSSKESFEASIHNILNDRNSNEHILKDLHFPTLNKWIIKDGVRYMIEKAEPHEKEDGTIEITINIKYICKCGLECKFSKSIKVDVKRRKPKQLQNQCTNPSCLLFFNIDSEFHYAYFNITPCEEKD